jgi:beta-phosphoglucomutase
MPQIKGLIFDLDGTLTLTQHFHFMAYHEVFKRHGINYTREDDYKHAGKGSSCIFPDVFKENGRTITAEEIQKYAEEKKVIYDKLIAESDIQAVPGIESFLKKMKQNGIKMAVASGNKLESIETILKKTGINQYFSIIVTNKDVKRSKPAPDIFLKAAEKLGLEQNQCIVFEDAENGIKAAKTAGIFCIGLGTGLTKEQLLKVGADFVVNNYNEIPVSCFLESIESDDLNNVKKCKI